MKMRSLKVKKDTSLHVLQEIAKAESNVIKYICKQRKIHIR